jgi:hypothetical protein
MPRPALPFLLLALACPGAPPASQDEADDSSAETDSPAETDASPSDTFDPPDFGDDDGAAEDTFVDRFPVDPDLGPTSLDGTWTGELTYIDVVPLSPRNPKCIGTVELTISGSADRHVVGVVRCETWDPNFSLGSLPASIAGPYGPLDGLLFATLDPTDLTQFRTDTSIVATNMSPFTNRLVFRLSDEGALVLDYDRVVVGLGQRISATLTRAGAP